MTMKRILTILISLFVLGIVGYVAAILLIPVVSPTPETLGVQADGNLAPCPDTPNCVSSQEVSADHQVAPIRYSFSQAEAKDVLMEALESVPNAEIVVNEPNYIRIETRSPLMGYIDDTEFYLDPDAPIIQMRAAARLGQSDMGANRARLEAIHRTFIELVNDRRPQPIGG